MSEQREGGVPPRVARLAWQSSVYALGNLVLKGAGLLLLPLYLDPALLPQADYGYLGLLETVAQLAIAVTGLGVAAGLLRYATVATDPREGAAYAASAWSTTAVAAAGTFVLAWLAAGPLAAWLAGDAGRTAVVRWAGAYVALKAVGTVPYTALRVRERPGVYLAALVLEMGVLVVGVWYALVVLEAGLEGVVAALAVSAGASALPLSAWLLLRTRSGGRVLLARRLLRFGWPLTLAALAGILLNAGDRIVLEALAGPDVLAVYVLAVKYGGVVNMLFVQSFNLAFAVLGLRALTTGPDAGFHRRVFRHFVAVAGAGVLLVSLLAGDVTAWLSPEPAYLEAGPLVLPVAFGFLLYGVYFVGMNVLYAAERTGAVAALVAGAAAVNLALNVVLVPVLGALGAALATVVAYGALAAVTARQARALRGVVFPWRALVVVALLVGGLWALGQVVAVWPAPERVLARIGLVAVYPLLLGLSGVYDVAAWRRLLAGARVLARRGD